MLLMTKLMQFSSLWRRPVGRAKPLCHAKPNANGNPKGGCLALEKPYGGMSCWKEVNGSKVIGSVIIYSNIIYRIYK